MKNALADSLVQLAVGILKRSLGSLLVTISTSLASGLNGGLQLGADSLVACLGLAVSLDSLDLGLNVCHFLLSYEDFGETPKQAKTLAGGAIGGNHLRELTDP